MQIKDESTTDTPAVARDIGATMRTPVDDNVDKLRAFVEKYEPKDISGFYWCSGSSFGDGYDWYCCVILIPHTARRRSLAVELRATSPYQLHNRLSEAGLDGGTVEELRKMCESAPRSPKLRRRKRTHA